MTVFTESGKAVEAVTYKIVPDMTEDHFIRPSDEYFRIVLKGSGDFDLDTRMLHATASGQNSPWMIDRIFTYGTLMKGECRDHVLDFNRNILSYHPAEVSGILYDFGDYPGMILSDEISRTVKGELYHLKDIGKSVSILDKIEDFKGYNEQNSLYTRAALKIKDRTGRYVWAWTYLINHLPTFCKKIESGNWRNRN